MIAPTKRPNALPNANPSAAVSVAIFGDVMWYIQRGAEELPRKHRTTVLSTGAAILGGSAVNIAEHLVGLGAKPQILSAIGSAEDIRIRAILADKGIHTGGLARYEGPTNVLVAFADERAARSIFIRHPIPSTFFQTLMRKLESGIPCVYGGSRDEYFRRALRERLTKRDNTLIFAPSYSIFEHSAEELGDFARRADVMILNHEEFRFFARTMGGFDDPLKFTACCVVTRASDGVIVHWKGNRRSVKSRSRSDEDVIGAGDAFLAGFLMSWLRSSARNPVLAAENGAKIAAKFVDKHAKIFHSQ